MKGNHGSSTGAQSRAADTPTMKQGVDVALDAIADLDGNHRVTFIRVSGQHSPAHPNDHHPLKTHIKYADDDLARPRARAAGVSVES